MCKNNKEAETNVWLTPPLVGFIEGDWSLHTYDPVHHDAAPLIVEQAWAVQTKQAQMLPWKSHKGELVPTEGLPIFVATIGETVVAAAGYNALYRDTNSAQTAELGGAYVGENFRGKGIYKPITETRIDFAKQAGLWLITFANNSSRATLKSCQFVTALPEEVPTAAFEYCLTCEFNPVKGVVPDQTTCCDGDDILLLKTTESTSNHQG